MVGAVLEIAHENLKSCITMIRDQRDDGLLLGFDGDMEMFDSLFTAIKPYSQKVKDSVYELDDILDYWVNQVLRLKHQEVKSDLLVKLQSSFLPSLHPSIRFQREMKSMSGAKQLHLPMDHNQGELGKTTLAQLIFNHGMVVNHFESRIWAYVSENFDLMRVTKDIIEAASGKLQDLLQRKGYLLVLDDWLKPILACGGKGASILVTTRSSKVAIVMGTMPPHELSMLSHNICWELFKHQAFVSNEVQEVGLERIGKEIVKKCGGVPLAAKVLGALLHFNKDKTKWQYISESTLCQTMSYCAIFPKDEIIRKQELIEFWMANGFISSNEILDAEDVGHGMNLAKSQVVAEEVCCITNDNDVTTLSERIHHISDHSWRSKSDSIQLHQVKSLRAYILPPYRYNTAKLSPHVMKCYSLQLFHFEPREEFPSSIGHLKHLSLPPQIGKLTSLSLTMFFVGKEEGLCMAELKLLKLKGDLHIKHLEKVKSVMDASKASMSKRYGPRKIEMLQPDTQQLQSLRVEGYKGVNFPEWMSFPSLKYLTYLSLEDCKSCFQLPTLGKLPSLKELRIDNMINLPNLTRLSREDGENIFPRLFTFHITQCPKLLNVPVGFQGLTCLQDLWIVSCKEVEGLHEALQHITTLKKLRLESLPNLEFLPDCIGNLPLLRQLHIWNCDKLTCLPPSLSLLSSLKELMIWGCHPELEKRCEKEMGEDWPKIAHVPCVEEENNFKNLKSLICYFHQILGF
ncbi:hypothetical protein AAZX31_02G028300 [Glycine max]